MIRVQGLVKSYQVHQRPPGLVAALKSLVRRKTTEVKAVDGIDFHLGPGERVGFLGPNGAGKTTTLKMLSGLLYPTSGVLAVDGHLPQRREAALLKKITLVMGQKQQLLWDLPPAETFELNRAIYEVPRETFRSRLLELTELLELGDLVKRPTRQLSLGERMKCELAAALVHAPKVLFLDEPTIGLDVSMQVQVRDFIRRYTERTGATLLLTSHYMDDVVALCPRIIVIDRGRLSFDGTLDELVKQVRPEKRLTLRFSRAVDVVDLERFGTVVRSTPVDATLQISQAKVSGVVSQALAALPVVDLTVEDAPLEEVMSELFARSRAQRDDVAATGAARGQLLTQVPS
jgi:ABC-2 type transport system ATP-binding protein